MANLTGNYMSPRVVYIVRDMGYRGPISLGTVNWCFSLCGLPWLPTSFVLSSLLSLCHSLVNEHPFQVLQFPNSILVITCSLQRVGPFTMVIPRPCASSCQVTQHARDGHMTLWVLRSLFSLSFMSGLGYLFLEWWTALAFITSSVN